MHVGLFIYYFRPIHFGYILHSFSHIIYKFENKSTISKYKIVAHSDDDFLYKVPTDFQEYGKNITGEVSISINT